MNLPVSWSARRERIFCLWDVAWGCNYRCPYCYFDAGWEFIARNDFRPSTETWLAFWERMHSLHSDGTVLRCTNTRTKIGHISDPAFRLMQEPAMCPVSRCTCAALGPCLVENDAQRLLDDRYSIAV